MSLRIAGLKIAVTAIAVVLTVTADARAQAAGYGPGLPMWQITDEDSTIYLTGSIHALPPGIQWKSPKLEGALQRATDVWFEIGNIEQLQAELAPMMIREMMSAGPPLSSRLTEDERTQLAAAIVRAKLPPNTAKAFETMKPWTVAMMLGVGPMMAAGGLKQEEGIDTVLNAMAMAQGDTISGFETAADQLAMIMGGTEEEQLQGLRMVLAMTPEESAANARRQLDASFAWAEGNVQAMTDYVAWMEAETRRATNGEAGAEVILGNRNENWAGQIEKLLAGKGVSFIAVGAAHLAGPDSVQEKLKTRGIVAKRY